MHGPMVQTGQLEDVFTKGRELHKTFILAMAKEKPYLDWIRFLYQFLDEDDPRFERWVAYYLAAMKLDLFCKDNAEPDPQYRHQLSQFPRSKDVEDQWYRRYAPGWIRSFWKRIRKEQKDPKFIAGVESMDSVMMFPEKLMRDASKTEGKGKRK